MGSRVLVADGWGVAFDVGIGLLGLRDGRAKTNNAISVRTSASQIVFLEAEPDLLGCVVGFLLLLETVGFSEAAE